MFVPLRNVIYGYRRLKSCTSNPGEQTNSLNMLIKIKVFEQHTLPKKTIIFGF